MTCLYLWTLQEPTDKPAKKKGKRRTKPGTKDGSRDESRDDKWVVSPWLYHGWSNMGRKHTVGTDVHKNERSSAFCSHLAAIIPAIFAQIFCTKKHKLHSSNLTAICAIDYQALYCWCCIPNHQEMNFKLNTLFLLLSDSMHISHAKK